jgi:hypothetical protein
MSLRDTVELEELVPRRLRPATAYGHLGRFLAARSSFSRGPRLGATMNHTTSVLFSVLRDRGGAFQVKANTGDNPRFSGVFHIIDGGHACSGTRFIGMRKRIIPSGQHLRFR